MRSIQLNPTGPMGMLSQIEVDIIQHVKQTYLHQLFRDCCLAVLNSGAHADDSNALFSPYEDFSVNLITRERGVKIELINPPEHAFVDGELITGVQEHLFSVLRDLLHVGAKHQLADKMTDTPSEITDMVFDILRHANAIRPDTLPAMITCWGGHSISTEEYDYTKRVGYELGLRRMNICTGCGPGAMKGPMKGATIGHAKQRVYNGRYVGITEPGIIAAEPPNPIVSELIIMPDIEKRLEAFVRNTHALVVFPGGVGTAEELLYILGILLDPQNKHQKLPLILTGNNASAGYFQAIDKFVGNTLGAEAQALYQIIIDDPERVAITIKNQLTDVRQYRSSIGDSYHFNWSLHIPAHLQRPFEPTHASMSALALDLQQPKAILAGELRKLFSGIVAGNVKQPTVKLIEQSGPFVLNAETALMKQLDALLNSFVTQKRMKLPGTKYTPCYEIR